MQTLKNVKISLNFNVRQPNKKTATTPIYCVVKVDSKQLKVPTGLKVNAWQWEKNRQQCAVNANMIATDQANNAAANHTINAIRMAYDDLFVYLCGSGDTFTATEIEKLIKETITAQTDNNDNMSNKNAIPPKRTTTATTLIKKAFAIYYPATTKESTLQVNEQRLKNFLGYVEQSKKGDTPKNHLSQDGLNDYRQFLIEEGKAPTTIGELCRMVARLINDVLCVHADFRKYNFCPVRFVAVKAKRKQSETKKTDLTPAEVKAVKECKGLNEKESEYRDLFIMQLETGVRVSDLPKLFTGEYRIQADGDDASYIIKTQKEDITATPPVTSTTKELQKRYKDGFEFVDFAAKAFAQSYNYYLRVVCQKAGLTRIIEYVDPNGNKKAEPLCKIISNHFARHTFITMKLREGYTPTEVSKMSGHADTRMIEEIYQHLTDEDKANAVIAAQKRVKGKAEAEPKSTDNDAQIIADQVREIHAYKKADEEREQNRLLNNFESEKAQLLFFVTHELGLYELENGDVVDSRNGEIILPHESQKSLYECVFGDVPTFDYYKELQAKGVTLLDAYDNGEIETII